MIGEQIVEIVVIVVEKGWRERKVRKMRTSRVVQDGRDGCFKMSTRSKRGEGKLFRRWTMLRWKYQLIRNLKALKP